MLSWSGRSLAGPLPVPCRSLAGPLLDRCGDGFQRFDSNIPLGLVWSGNPKQGNDRHRSMPLKTLTPLFDVDATFVSLQKDPRPDDKALLDQRTDIVDLTADLTDFVETAAFVSCLDLVITVCTSVAHLAGTLGRPTWVMLPYLPDWRWLLERDDSPWYPAVRLFRQDDTHDYAGGRRVRADGAAGDNLRI